jgi:hypothetical protein
MAQFARRINLTAASPMRHFKIEIAESGNNRLQQRRMTGLIRLAVSRPNGAEYIFSRGSIPSMSSGSAQWAGSLPKLWTLCRSSGRCSSSADPGRRLQRGASEYAGGRRITPVALGTATLVIGRSPDRETRRQLLFLLHRARDH